MATTLTTGRPWRVILFFCVPLLLGNIVQQLYQFADAIVVGRLPRRPTDLPSGQLRFQVASIVRERALLVQTIERLLPMVATTSM